MNKFFIVIFALFLFFQGCGNDHFLVDSNYRSKVEQRFELKKQLAGSRSEALFGVFNSGISTQEAEALKFLYAYMPLSDLADYDGSFYLKLVQSSFKARETFSWGRQVPEDIFRHFVLPYRVNNENLDSARWVFYGELKERLKGMSMKQAALEVNHWCHEKVIYQPTDGRTSAPLSTVKTSYGRCGEESTFLVTALRAAGIPARQVYTPRWAHCDDNHAWVEVWIDGKWNYMGACEPEADLNIAWFTAPAKRAMLVHTKVFGDYAGSEEVVRKTEDFTEINVTSNYADVKKIFVRVVDQSGKPAVKASVDFGLYNYAEFYPIASKLTDTHGTTFLTTGFGDLLVSASQNGMSGFKKISVGQTDTLEVKLESHRDTTYTVDMDFYPPVEKTIPPADEQMQKANSVRLHQEDSIRTIYRATFIDSAKSALLAEQSGLDKKQLVQLMKAGMGNWMELKAFVERNRTSAHIFPLLNAVSAKDLRDTRAEILEDHLRNTLNSCKPGDYENPELFYSSVLNPRVRNENLTAYRKLLHDKFSSFASADRDLSAGKIVSWIKENIKTDEEANYYNVPLTPGGVLNLKVSDKASRDIFFVALCRSLGIPARIEPASVKPQYFSGGRWLNVYFENSVQSQPEKGTLVLHPDAPAIKQGARYYTHFTIARLVNGVYTTQEYSEDAPLSEFQKPVEVETGSYRLITGSRRGDGTVLARLSFFNVNKGSSTGIAFVQRSSKTAPKVLGNLSLATELPDNGAKAASLAKLFSNDYIILGWIEPDKEPTKHVLNDLAALKNNFEKWNGSLTLLLPEGQKKALDKDFAAKLPVNCKLMNDTDNKLINKVNSAFGARCGIAMPLIVVLNKKGDIIFSSQGYNIGLGEQLLKTVM